MFKNWHVVLALLIAPVLAILAWFAVGHLLGEQPQPAVAGEAYPLIEKSNCRYASGQCDLQNNDLKLTIRITEDVGPGMQLSSSHRLESVLASVGETALDPGPRAMRPGDGQGLVWHLTLASPPSPTQRIRLVASRSGSAYFADASTQFAQGSD
ncbi:MAG: hypothetical protein ACI87W_003312 [Halieaceae bacterium]|jgi:hypothetical protein